MEALLYRHLEAAIIDVLQVKSARLGSLRARMRRLRGFGLPAEKPGTGAPMEYSYREALAILLALELEHFGVAPRNAVPVALSVQRVVPFDGQWEGEDSYVVLHSHRGDREFTIASTKTQLEELRRRFPRGLAIINVAECVRQLDAALHRQLTGRG
jgi:hypothetical protein